MKAHLIPFSMMDLSEAMVKLCSFLGLIVVVIVHSYATANTFYKYSHALLAAFAAQVAEDMKTSSKHWVILQERSTFY